MLKGSKDIPRSQVFIHFWATPQSPPQLNSVRSQFVPKDSTDSELGMASLLASGSSFRHPDALDALGHLSKRVVERRVEGELPLGQVPSVG